MTKRRILAGCLLAAALAVGIQSTPALAQAHGTSRGQAHGTSRGQASEPLTVHITQVDTSAFPKVVVYVSVTNAAGEPAPVNLDKLRLFEDGNAIQPDEIRGLGESEPLTTLLVMDVSGSMLYADKLDSAKAAAYAYIQQMRAGDEAGILAFNTAADYVQPVTADRGLVNAAVSGLAAAGDTAMYDALLKGVAILADVSGRKAIITLTDGMDNRSKRTAADVVAAIGPAGLSISTIGLGEPAQSNASVAGLDEDGLQALANQAGGTYGYANDPGSLRRLYEQFGRALQSEYVLTYSSPAALRDGVGRALSVKLSDAIPSVAGAGSYNPGGLIPEVASASSSWPLFFGLLLALVVMFFAPEGIRWGLGLVEARRESKPAEALPAKPAAPSRIRLQEPKPPQAPRVKIH